MLIKDLFKYWTYQVFLPGTILREKYKAFKTLLIQDTRAHEIMADLEEIYYQKKKVDIQVVEEKCRKLASCVSLLVIYLSKISPIRYHSLRDYFKKFDFYIKFLLASEQYALAPPFVINLNDIDCDSPLMVGGKASNLGIVYNNLKVQIPKSFVVTTNAFRYFLEYNNLSKDINRLLSKSDITHPSNLLKISQALTRCIMDAKVPGEIEDLIMEGLANMQSDSKKELKLAVRSSAVAEDGICSFAGQYKSMLSVKPENVTDAYKEVLASKYSVHALCYRIIKGIPDTDTPMAVLIMEMLDAKVSGVMYTRDIEHSNSGDLVIYSVKGYGEPLVSGKANPCTTKVARHSKKIISEKNNGFGFEKTKASKLALTGFEIENHFGQPQDIEWCENNSGDLYILQARPLPTRQLSKPCIESDTLLKDQSSINKKKTDRKKIDLRQNQILLENCSSASSGVGSGQVFCLKHLSQLDQVPAGTILVTKHPLPELVTIIEKLTAVVTDTGSAAGHFASVAREFSVPMLVNTGSATKILEHGSKVTVDTELKMVFKGEPLSGPASAEVCPDPFVKSPFMKTLSSVMKFVSPLKLINPASSEFTPEGCRSFHDIIRFCHEKAVQEMFSHGRRKGGRKKGAIKLVSDIPMLFYILDVGEGIKQKLPASKEVHVNDVVCTPFRSVYKGLSHPDIKWEQFSNYDWATYDNIVMSGGIISPDDAQFGSYAIVASDYLNINLRFGYHFVILDAFCSKSAEKNYILFRFSGGGGNPTGRELRVAFLVEVLTSLGFVVQTKGELVDGQIKHAGLEEIKEKLDWVGRLLGATRLMDMHLKDGVDIKSFARQFLNGKYDFRSVIDDEMD